MSLDDSVAHTKSIIEEDKKRLENIKALAAKTKQQSAELATQVDQLSGAIKVRKEVLGGDWHFYPKAKMALLQRVMRRRIGVCVLAAIRAKREHAAVVLQKAARQRQAHKTVDRKRKLRDAMLTELDHTENGSNDVNGLLSPLKKHVEKVAKPLEFWTKDFKAVVQKFQTGAMLDEMTTLGIKKRMFRVQTQQRSSGEWPPQALGVQLVWHAAHSVSALTSTLSLNLSHVVAVQVARVSDKSGRYVLLVHAHDKAQSIQSRLCWVFNDEYWLSVHFEVLLYLMPHVVKLQWVESSQILRRANNTCFVPWRKPSWQLVPS